MTLSLPRRAVREVGHLAVLAVLGSLLVACRSSARPATARPTTATTAANGPIVIAHRGASGHRPEHTLEGYALAIAMGADYIEPDLVATQDGVLVARHENEIGGTTDVATKYPERRRRKAIDRDSVTGWFTEDFTAAELRTLRAKERLSFRSHEHDGQYHVPTFDEILVLADSAGRRRGRVVGVYPELKHPTYFRSIGLPLEGRLLDALTWHGLNRREAQVFIQCFEVGPLRALRAQTPVRLVQLLAGGERPYDLVVAGDRRTGEDLVTPAGLRVVAEYADAIGVNTRMVIGADSTAVASTLIRDAHAAGLKVHVWTLRPEAVFLAARYRGDPAAEVRELARLGVDGMFGDYPDIVVKALKSLR